MLCWNPLKKRKKEFFAWENSLINLNTLKWKYDPVLAAKKMSSVSCFPLHSVFLGPGMLACEWSSESTVHKHDAWLWLI